MIILGYKPDLFHCLNCHKKISDHKNYFDITRGGVICLDCLEKSLNYKRLTISANLIKILRFADKNSLSELIKLKIDKVLEKELDNFIRSFQRYYK